VRQGLCDARARGRVPGARQLAQRGHGHVAIAHGGRAGEDLGQRALALRLRVVHASPCGAQHLEARLWTSLRVAEDRREARSSGAIHGLGERRAQDDARGRIAHGGRGDRVGDGLERVGAGERGERGSDAGPGARVVADARRERGDGRLASLELLVRLARRLAGGLAKPAGQERRALLAAVVAGGHVDGQGAPARVERGVGPLHGG
jgi:hypothetical protein